MELLKRVWRQKIGRQLQLGFGVILIAVTLFGALAWKQTESLWGEIEGMYTHPLTVRRALADLQFCILTMHRDVKDLFLATNDQERQATIQALDVNDAWAVYHFDRIRASYLGPKKDVDEAFEAFLQWRSIRAETIRILRAGRVEESTSRASASGLGGKQVALLLDRVRKISEFALNRGDLFHATAYAHWNQVRFWLAAALVSLLFLTVGIGLILLRGIKTPLHELTTAANLYRQGRFDVRSQCPEGNEFGTLATSFNELAAAVQEQLQARQSAVGIAAAMLRHEKLRPFCHELLQELMQQTGSQVAAIYLRDERGAQFNCFESIGLDGAARASFSAAGCEGEFGTALATRRIQHIAEIPEGTKFVFNAVSGTFRPRGIITIPVISGADVVAMVSLASLHGYAPPVLTLIHDIWTALGARLNSVLAQRRLRTLAWTLEQQNRELEAQKVELARQADELSEQNAELESQKRHLDEASRLKSVFLSNMSHELRTPLNSVIALSGVLSRHLTGLIPEREFGYLEVIERNGKHLLALINQVLDLARIEAGHAELSLKLFSVRHLVSEVVDTLEIQAKEKNIALRNAVDDSLAPIRSDATKCRHILLNLIANAIKFTPSGAVEIQAVQLDQTIQIKVSDTGIGIEPDRLAVIFEEFRQADERTSREYGGSGLGLSIAMKYARLLQGNISVESSPGKGSVFTLTLPLALGSLADAEPAHDGPGAAASIPAGPLPDAQGKCIFVVDDSEPAVIQLTDILSAQGYSLRVARNGREALEQLESLVPDAVILDLMMPEVDGFQFLEAFRSHPRNAHIPVLILTAKFLTREELSFLKGNHIHQLIQKGDINGTHLLQAVRRMVFPPNRHAAPSAPLRAVTSGRKPLILVAEDNPDNLRTARALLQDDYRVIEASDGRAALEQARLHSPDLILMDLSMPVMDGIQALEEIRGDDALRNLPVIALTASAMKGTREEILARGFDGYISKPIDSALLQSVLRETLTRHDQPLDPGD